MSSEGKSPGEFSLLVSRLVRKLSLLERDEKVCFGVTISQCYAVETLSQNGKLSMKELSREMGVAVSTMTRILDVMVRDGFAKRENDPKDRRLVCVELTTKGRNLAAKLKRCGEDYLGTIFDKIPTSRRERVTKSLKFLLNAVEQHPSCCQHVDRTETPGRGGRRGNYAGMDKSRT